MEQEHSSPFYDQLLFFLQDDLIRKKNEEGWDDSSDQEFSAYGDSVSKAIRAQEPKPLYEIIEQYQHLFGERGPSHLEQKILQAFPDSEMISLNLKPLRIYRGLPRLYRKNQPQFSKLKPHFSYLPSLKRSAAIKPLLSLYQHVPVPADARMAIVCRVLPDGLGDYYAGREAATLIKQAFPRLDVHFFVISEQELPSMQDLYAERWEGSESQLRLLQECDLVLQIPTACPQIDEIKAKMDPSAGPKWECVGEYGFVETEAFHPQSQAHSMGLHFLERGILTRLVDSHISIHEMESESMVQWLFENQRPDQEAVACYLTKSRFFLAYLFSSPGIYVYLHALLKSLENDDKNIDICVPDFLKIITYFDQRLQAQLDPIEKRYGVARIVLCIDSQSAVMNLAPAGKTLRILCPRKLHSSDFQRLLSFSEEFVACRGDQSFSEAVSCNKGFFYEPRDHSRFFLKDLIAVAQNRIPSYSTTIDVLRLSMKILEHNSPLEEGEWIDEIAVQQQEKMDLIQIAEAIGQCLQDSKTFAGFKKLNRILFEEFSCNAFLVQLVQRSICHRRNPKIDDLEEKEIGRFIAGQQSFSLVVEHLNEALTYCIAQHSGYKSSP
jgi:hypothetical protein